MNLLLKFLLLVLSRDAYAIYECDRGNCGCCNDHSCTWSKSNGYFYCSNGCEVGYYGQQCKHACKTNCLSCDNFESCNACIKGFWGPTCQYQCRRGGCEDRICDITTGTCLSCDKGFYGNNCTNPCPKLCTNNSCKSDGTCFSCEKGYYGQECNKLCPVNCTDSCDMVTGACSNCIEGSFGIYCTSNCPINCLSCSSEIHCSSCITGYKGLSCQDECSNCKSGTPCGQWDGNCRECPPGLYGSACAYTCLYPCKSCNMYNGQCTECIDGTYGKNPLETYPHCSHMCSSHCLNKTCDTITGYCIGGCLNGYWGDVCNNRCSEKCKDQICSRNNGHCINGCEDGYTSFRCNCHINCECNSSGACYRCKGYFRHVDRDCTCRNDLCSNLACTSCTVPDFYPENAACCPCSKLCKGNACESASKCSFGCKEGYRGEGCSEQCKDVALRCSECTVDYTLDKGKCLKCLSGYYVGSTSKDCVACSGGCLNDICNRTNGECTSGCKDGKWGIMFDRLCSSNCQKCDQENGTCLVCKAGKYLSDCSKSCSENCNASNSVKICAIENGACLNGCDTPDKYGIRCENVCNSNCIDNKCDWKTSDCVSGCVFNHYGRKCQNECNVNCKEGNKTSPCDPSTGYCIAGCNHGYFGNSCDQKCSPKRFARTCKSEEKKRSCNDSTGFCTSGCEDGFHGNICESKCSDYCVNGTCHQVTAECLYGCIDGYTGLQCTQARKQMQQEGITTGEMIGIAFGSVLIGILIGGVLTLAFIIWNRRHARKRDESDEQADVNYENNIPMTYEDLIERDERTYGQIVPDRQLSTQAAEYVNF